MATLHREANFEASADHIWNRIKDFYGVHTWLPGITATAHDKETKDGRLVTLEGGAQVVEQLVDHGPRMQTYRFVKGPLPLAKYESRLEVHESGKGSRVTWDAKFEPAGATEDEVSKLLAGFYDGGLSALKKG